MTTINEARESVYKRFNDNYVDTPFFLEGEAQQAATSGPWARLSVRNTDSAQETLGAPGNRRFLRKAVVFVQLFVETDEGLKDIDGNAQSVRAIFEGVTFDGLRFTDTVFREVGADGKWFQATVTAQFDYEELK